MKYRARTKHSSNRDYIFQLIFDSEDYMFFCVLYTIDGHKVKHCKKADTEDGAIDNVECFIEVNINKIDIGSSGQLKII